MTSFSRIAALLITLLLVSTAACTATENGAESAPAIEDASILDGTEWWLAEIVGQPTIQVTERPINLRLFAAGEVRPEAEYGGFTGCNFFGGLLQLEQENIFLETGLTRNECPSDELKEQETAILTALRSAGALGLSDEGRLQVLDDDDDVSLIYRPKPIATVDDRLADSEWRLIELDGQGPLPGAQPELSFNAGQESDGSPTIGGNTGCNSFGGEIRTAEEGVLTLAEVANTEMACAEPEGVMAQEADFLNALHASSAYRLDGDRLYLLDEAGQTRLTFQRKLEVANDPTALIERGWQLTSIGDDIPQADRPITLVFHDARRFSGQSDCRSYLGTYQAGADDIIFNSVSMLGEIEAGCQPEELYLPGNGDYRLSAASLEINPARGPTFHYEPLPDAADMGLAGSSWRLLARTAVADPAPRDVISVLPETEITLQFDDERISGSAGCNGYGASYQLQDETALSIGVAEATAMACLGPEGVMAQERAYLEALANVQSYSISGPHLWLDLAGGGALLLTNEAAPAN